MPANYEREIRSLQSKIAEMERREREIDRKMGEFNDLVRERQRLDNDSHQAVVQELAHLDRQMSMLATRAEEQIAKLDLDRDDFGSLITDVGGINNNVSSILSNVGTVDANVGTALTSINTINQDVGTVLTQQNAISSDVFTAKQRADQALTAANSASQTANSINSSVNQLNNRVNTVESTAASHNSRITNLESQFTQSFVSTTQIETLHGPMQIRDILPGMRILRPAGYGLLTRLLPETILERPKRALISESLLRVELADGTTFTGTPEHAIACLLRGHLRLIRVGELREADTLFSYRRWGRLGIRVLKRISAIGEVTGERAVYNLRVPHRQFLIDGGVLAH